MPRRPAAVGKVDPIAHLLGSDRPDASLIAGLIASPAGQLITVANDDGLVLLEFADNRRLARQSTPLERLFGISRAGDHPVIDQTATEIAEYFAGKRTVFTVPLVIKGTPFQESVWRRLLEIPYGETRAYADLAEQLGVRNGQRAVGLANGANRISIIIPCHRVIERSGGLRGYGGGLWRKKLLLDLEHRGGPAGALSGTPLGALSATV